MKKLLIMVFSLLLLVGCSSIPKFEMTDKELRQDLIGQTLGTIKISKDNLTDFKLIDKSINKDTAEVLADISIDHTVPNSGSLNKDLKKNDVIHSLKGQITLTYKKFDKGWHFSTISNYIERSYEKTEQENLMKRIPFNKDDKMVLQDLKDTNIGIKVIGDHIHTITFGSNEVLGYKPVTRINDFKIINVETNTSNDLLTNVVIKTDIQYKVENSIYQDNGTYDVKGSFTAVYKLSLDETGNEYWKLQSTKDMKLEN